MINLLLNVPNPFLELTRSSSFLTCAYEKLCSKIHQVLHGTPENGHEPGFYDVPLIPRYVSVCTYKSMGHSSDQNFKC